MMRVAMSVMICVQCTRVGGFVLRPEQNIRKQRPVISYINRRVFLRSLRRVFNVLNFHFSKTLIKHVLLSFRPLKNRSVVVSFLCMHTTTVLDTYNVITRV